jgi:soluble lytic murein transglycosylase-like protein
MAETVKADLGGLDGIIQAAADAAGIPPEVLKAICRRESNFKSDAINPEASYSLNGTSYTSASSAGRAALRAWLLDGNDPAAIGLNPSIGLAQVRVAIARKVLNQPDLSAAQLFVPETNLAASAALLAELYAAGITLDTIDAYNEGQALRKRNFEYRDAVAGFAADYAGDFS